MRCELEERRLSPLLLPRKVGHDYATGLTRSASKKAVFGKDSYLGRERTEGAWDQLHPAIPSTKLLIARSTYRNGMRTGNTAFIINIKQLPRGL
jgi:hypothetical protein